MVSIIGNSQLQYRDSIIFVPHTCDSLPVSNNALIYVVPDSVIVDTVNVFLLIASINNGDLKTVKGFLIRRKNTIASISFYQVIDTIQQQNYFTVLGYLDKNRKPFSKDIIIWQSKTILQ